MAAPKTRTHKALLNCFMVFLTISEQVLAKDPVVFLGVLPSECRAEK
jgi:hypothetical protein